MSLLPEDMKASPLTPPTSGGSGSVPPPPKPLAPPAVPTKPPTPSVVPPMPPKPVSPTLPPMPMTPAPPVAPKPAAPAMKPPTPAVKPLTPPSVAPKAEAPSFGGGLRVSLMPSDFDSAGQPDPRRRALILVLALVVETLAIGTAYFFLLRTVDERTTRKTEVMTKQQALSVQVTAAEKGLQDALAWNTQLAAARETLDGHIRWTSLFAYLEARTMPTIKYQSFSGNDQGVVNLDAVGLSYRDVAQQIVALRNDPMVLEVRSSSAAARVSAEGEITGVSFTMMIKFKPEIWKKPVAPAVAPAAAVPAAPNL